ncbi:NLI interacting factor-like phosphatase-domain-containing protein [Aspergillus californicus]
MARGGAFDKLFSKTLARYTSSLKPRLRLTPTTKVLMPRAKKRAPMNTPSSVNTRTAGMKSQDSMAGTPSPGWRPYNGRWNAKVAYRDNHHETAQGDAPTNSNQTPRRGRAPKNQRFSRNNVVESTELHNGQPRRSLSPRRDLPTQSQQPQYDPNWTPANNALPEFPMMNPFTMFGGFPMLPDPSAGFSYQPPFLTPEMPEQLLQSQFSQPLDQSLPNPPFFPLLGAGNPFAAMPPFLPPAPFMDFDMQDQMPLHTMNPMSTSFTPAEFFASPSAPAQNSPGAAHNTHRQASKAPWPPSATKQYIDQSSLPPKPTPTPHPLLVILDLNGTLIYRKTKKFPPSFSRRVGLDAFLATLVDKYKVMIWSSSTPAMVAAVCQKLFSEPRRKQLVAEWGRDRLGLSKSEYNSKIQVYKTLGTVWSSKEVQASYPKKPKTPKGAPRRWNQTNTILIDDSKIKALSEPYNLIKIPEFTNAPGVDESMIFPKVLQLLEILARSDDVSKMLHSWDSAASRTSILELDMGSTDPNLTTGTGNSQNQTQPDPEKDPALARKIRRKAQKTAKKAARRATAIQISAQILTPTQSQNPNPSQDSNPSSSANLKELVNSSEETNRSSSPVSSVQSENFLLDRLEESLKT